MAVETLKVDFFANGLCFHCNMAQRELQEYLQFHSETESAWGEKNNDLQSNLNEILNKYPEEHHQDIVESYSWELHQNQYKFPNMHRESLIITIYNFLESELNQLCGIIAESIDRKIRLKDLHGKGINRALLYLSKVAEFEMSKMGSELPYIKNVNLLRNQIVHSGGVLPDNADHELNIFVMQNLNLSGQPGHSVTLDSEFIGEFIERLIAFFNRLDEEIQLFMKR
ncbi:MAG: hypothetical protein BMS9Abin33_0064 [Gammaproteobacteria bacterium]|nr:MAG: hypothetical protein BMS9Abin33_0064 [Gammaproteobacteria bacterium]